MLGSAVLLSIDDTISLNDLTTEAQTVTKASDCPVNENTDCLCSETGTIYVNRIEPDVDPVKDW